MLKKSKRDFACSACLMKCDIEWKWVYILCPDVNVVVGDFSGVYVVTLWISFVL